MKLKKFIQFNENMMDMDMDMHHDSKPTNYMFFENLTLRPYAETRP